MNSIVIGSGFGGIAAALRLKSKGHNVTLIDVREDGMDPGLLAGLLAKHGDDVLLNRKSTTWRELSEDDKGQKAYTLLSKNPSLMKRPLIVIDGGVSFVGWSQETRAELNKA